MPPFRLGDIVEATIADPNGRNAKPRPVLILTPTNQVASDGQILVAAISSSMIPDPLPEDHFELPYQHHPPHPRTRLTRRCVVKCDWRCVIGVGDILRKRGTAPERVLHDIAAYFARRPMD